MNYNMTYHYTVDDIKYVEYIRCCPFNYAAKDDCSCIAYCFHNKATIRWHTLSSDLRHNPLT